MTQPVDQEDTAYDYLTQDTDEWDYFIKVNTEEVVFTKYYFNSSTFYKSVLILICSGW